ncbi:septum site-determining protein MinC [Sulfurospirillum multivorans]|uniref:Septum site-determining protein minC n=2 Tax=Sulfurospirillum multivorans TaxID=66821 RepID=A0AA86AJC8_SULMK|nr:septum site-determining protein MinC [Sulfurospirillum multivorans]AHJ11604.1 putative septum site-determining protein minC [Sulfurospirillum multivorans DSM 12446]QEH05104.1 putative septum site-determining protein minC [Sulfurospirillum multivorans]
MKVTQKNVRVFHIEIDDEASFLDYFRKNSLLLREFFLLIEGEITKNIVFVLEQSGVCYKEINQCNIRFGGIKKEAPALEEAPKKEKVLEVQPLKQMPKLKLYDRPIRSGEEIVESLPIVIFGRVNSGAKVFCEESMSIYGIIDGLVQCDGEYIVLSGMSPRGHLIFNGEIVDREMLKLNVLQKIVMRDNVLEIKEVV